MSQNGNAVALATLVRVDGSSYRAPGARLLIGQDGAYAGSISGGCLEAEIVRKAPWLVRHGAVVERYSTLFDDTAEIPYGLGCGGTVDVLLEPAGTPEFDALFDALAASLTGDTRHVSTYLPSAEHTFAREITDGDGNPLFRSQNLSSASKTDSFTERLTPPQRLFVFGAGDDARPLVQMAALLGWTVLVLDSRPQWARPQRFPEAHRVIATGTPAAKLGPRPGPDDAVVLMSHSYEQDRASLQHTLPCQPRYLGLLGSRHRSALLVAEAAKALDLSLAHACERLFAPVGLDLGGDGAEAIALSIVAEIQACLEGKLGASRRLTPEVIAAQIEAGGASRYLQTQCAL